MQKRLSPDDSARRFSVYVQHHQKSWRLFTLSLIAPRSLRRGSCRESSDIIIAMTG
ncbi:hypothetical protein RMSM_04580 [Rhodopirellula maiorica SM1]|uniref:Uncharacterized protein n=1 Tax=Rhodopirellula maiorica SM1 TaxID=1265738 RepID=M5RSX7_9BACT|nr:hypothetical protein RMSM_04580 [Rhodopirellula maiorica SM1]